MLEDKAPDEVVSFSECKVVSRAKLVDPHVPNKSSTHRRSAKTS